MLDEFVSRLRNVGLLATVDELREIVWLAQLLPADQGGSVNSRKKSEKKGKKKVVAPVDSGPESADAHDAHDAQGAQGASPEATVGSARLHSPTQGGAIEASTLRVPGAAATGQLEPFRRALMPLARRVPSRRRYAVDEEATASRAAETGIRYPVYRPVRERWLDLILIIEASPSIDLWTDTLVELVRMFRSQCGFRSVVRYALNDPQARRLTTAGGREVFPASLMLDRDRKQLIVFATDATTTRWRTGAAQTLLYELGSLAIVNILHLLPRRMWRHTFVGEPELMLSTKRPGDPNIRMDYFLPQWQGKSDAKDSLAVPVVGLDAAMLLRWSRMIAARGGALFPGVLLAKSGRSEAAGGSLVPSEEAPPAEKVARFRSIVSRSAYDLAVFLSVSDPLTVSVMRLVQRTMLPDTSTAELAEFFVGGLIRRTEVSEGMDQRGGESSYRFDKGLPEELIRSLRYSEEGRIKAQLGSVGKYLREEGSRRSSFDARFPSPKGEARLTEWALPFAEVSQQVLSAHITPSEDVTPNETIRSEPLSEPVTEIAQATSSGNPDGAETGESTGNVALRVTVLNGNLSFLRQPLLVGHYQSWELTGSEKLVDGLIGGAMSASLAAGLYPEAIGSHQIFVNSRGDPEKFLGQPRPPFVVVVGLGEEGKLRSSDLIRSVREATVKWGERLAETPGKRFAHFELAATLIGSGGMGISVATSAQAVAQGVREANEKLVEGGKPYANWLQLVELYRDRATDALRALKILGESVSGRLILPSEVSPGNGALGQPLDAGYRGTTYDFISATTDRDEFGEPKIVYTLDTKRARSEVRAQATQLRLVGELIRRASNDANRDTQIGRTLFQMLVPVEMEAHLGGSSEMLLELDDGTAAIPWELLDAPEDGRGGLSTPWAIRAKLVRKLRTVEFRQQVSDARIEDAVLVIGEPFADPKKYPPLPAARAEAEAVRDALSGPSGLETTQVHALIAAGDGLGADAAAVTSALLARRYRIVHIAGHGEPEELRVGKPPRLRGVVLSDDTFLGPREVQAMRVVPELVFLNCCHLAADPNKLLKGGYDRASFAAGVAKQLIRVGVRCVVAAGWAVEDAAANSFATAFYRSLLGGQRFMDAVHAGRVAARAISPLGNTWAAYQCYGDPDWVWRRGEDSPRKTPAPIANEFVGIASPQSLALALETLAVRSATQGASPESQREKIRHLEARFEAEWGGMGAVAEAFGLACAGAKDIEHAIHWYGRALAANDGSASVKASEQLANLRARLAWERVEQASKTGKAGRPAAALEVLLVQGRKDIQSAIAMLGALVAIAPTIERESLLGSAYKRLALLEAVADRAKPEVDAIAEMAEHYRRAEALARSAQHAELFYPALNRMAAELIAHLSQPGWKGFDRDEMAGVRQNLDRKVRADPDFWSVVSVTEMSVYEALAAKDLAAQLPAILAAYEDLRRRAGSSWMWASVADQAGFVLGRFSAGASGEAKAAKQLLGVLRKYAGL